MNSIQILSAAIGGTLFGLIVILIARRGILSMRYTLGWLFIAGCVVLGGVFGGLIGRIARGLGLNPYGLVTSIAGVSLLAITLQLSITVSGLTERVRTLAESCAILEQALVRATSKPEVFHSSAGTSERVDDASVVAIDVELQ